VKRLVLFRHAKSSWEKRGLADHDRPLAGRGRRDAPRMGERLSRRGVEPNLLLASSAKRAQETAELLAGPLEHRGLACRTDPGIYLASPGELLEILKAVDDDVVELILVGHNPGLTQLANMLLPELKLHNLPTAGAVAIDADTSSWHDLDAAALTLRFYDYPKNPEPASA
jgi:phosphohistidine phosphatase